jgi:signal transduction histidine kinase
VIDATGAVVAAPTDELATMMEQMHGLAAVTTPRGDPVSQAVVVDGKNVGAVMLRFPVEAMDAERHVRDALARTALVGVLIASLVALVVAIFVSARVTRPVTALTTAAGDLAAGRREARVDVEGPAELRTLAVAFNDMADHLDREDVLRRHLVADVAHELRTPLTILQGSTEALLDGVDQPTPEVLASLNDEVTRLRRLVADLEALAAAEAASLQLQTTSLDLADVANDALDLLRPLADDGGLVLLADTSSARVTGDADRLHQIAVNLIANAIKFTPTGGTVTVRTRRRDGSATLEVSDTGPGIPADDLPHVFERFWRGANGAKAPGSGIGLAVVAELTAAHHGTVAVTSEPGTGARFVVSLPLA